MPVGLHLFLMFATMFAAFFAAGIAGWEWRDELHGAGVPRWAVPASALVGLFGALGLYRVLPARCPGCGWPVAFLRFGPKWVYRCLACQHVHCTMWGKGKRTTGLPYYNRVWLPPLRLDGSAQQRITLSGHLYRPCTLVLALRSLPSGGRELKGETRIEARLTDEQGATLIRVEGPLAEWEREAVLLPWQTGLELWHPGWRDVALREAEKFALEIGASQVDPLGPPLEVRPALEFLHGSPATTALGR